MKVKSGNETVLLHFGTFYAIVICTQINYMSADIEKK